MVSTPIHFPVHCRESFLPIGETVPQVLAPAGNDEGLMATGELHVLPF
jgi:predicted methyltransferase MtxX (methanogen marker protein 4)